MNHLVTLEKARDLVCVSDPDAFVNARSGGYTLELSFRGTKHALCTTRRADEPRLFKSFDSVAAALTDLGITRVTVDLSELGIKQKALL